MSSGTSTKNKAGIALVIVLGFLALLTLLAVSFSTFMRSERMGSVFFERISSGRDFTLFTALEMAINESDQVLAANAVSPKGKQLFYTNSVNSTIYRNPIVVVKGTSGFICYDLVGLPANNQLTWSEVPLPQDVKTNLPYGMLYCYYLINETDMIDCNYFNTNLNKTVVNYAAITNQVYRYIKLYGPGDIPAALRKGNSHYTTYSRYRQSYISGVADLIASNYTADRVWLGGTAQQLSTNTAVIQAHFTKAGALDADFLMKNLLDYVDPDITVNSHDNAFRSKPVPMVCEIAITGSVTRVDDAAAALTTYRVATKRFVEVWFPFETTNSGREFTISIPDTTLTLDGIGQQLTFPAQEITKTDLTDPVIFVITSQTVSVNFPLPLGASLPAGRFAMEEIEITPGGGETPAFTPMFQLPIISANRAFAFSKEVNDPRFNGDPDAWEDHPTSHTIGKTNSISKPPEHLLPLFVSEKPLRQVGELYFLADNPTLPAPNQPWSYVKIEGVNSNVLDYFTIHSNLYVHGIININSRNAARIQAALLNQNIPFKPPLTQAEALTVAQAIAARTLIKPFIMRSDLASIPAIADNPRILAACSDLLDLYGNTFTVFLATQLYVDDPENRNYKYDGPDIDCPAVGQTLIAQFWRDPVTKETKRVFQRWLREWE